VRARAAGALACAAALGLCGARCGGGDGGGGGPPVTRIASPDARCAALSDEEPFPPGYAFVPGVAGRVLAATFGRTLMIPLDVERVPFRVPAGTAPFELPNDADGNGVDDVALAVDDVFGLAPDLALVTTSGSELVVFVDPDAGPRPVRVEVPASFSAEDFRGGLPAPGTSRLQTGFANTPCLAPPEDAEDSRGNPLAEALAVAGIEHTCTPGVPSFAPRYTSGVALAAGHLFVSSSNLGADPGSDRTQFLPAAVTVWDLDLAADPPRVAPSTATADGRPYLLASPGAFNATHVQPYTTPGGRELVLVTFSGAIGIPEDDPRTSALEGGAVRLSDGGIDVIDAARAQLVATIPLEGANPSFRGLAVHAGREVGVVGDVSARRLYAVDLSALDLLPDPPDGEVQVLDGTGGAPNAILFDGRTPFRIPGLPAGAPASTCPGWVESAAWNAAGDRLLALESCDGALVEIEVGGGSGPPTRGDFRLLGVASLVAPLAPDTLGLTRLPAALQVRPGEPGVDFSGPDVFFLVSEPEGFLCGIRVASR
jgi:hypothetical protein